MLTLRITTQKGGESTMPYVLFRTKAVYKPNSWRVSTIKLAHGWLERGVEAIFEPRFSHIQWRDILSHLF